MSKKFALLASLVMLASTSAFADGGWAAIVFNPTTGSWGSSHGSYSRQDAENAALGFCGADCAGVDAVALEGGQSGLKETYVYNGWVAYATGDNGHWATSGIHDSQYDAEETAYTNCGGQTDNCGIIRSTSSFSYQADVDGTNVNNATPAAQ
jgi:hypothetical protein